MDQNTKDFSLALYNKLWDNINNKDTRLWTFLSIYGASVALAFGAGKVANLELFTLLVIFVITLWALFIVANASWWDSRNRLMVGGIEDKFPEATKGVVPPFYQGIGSARMERLNEVSVWVMAGVALVLYLKAAWPYLRPNTLVNGDVLIPFILLYLFLGLGVYLWLNRIESLSRSYFATVESLASVTQKFTLEDINAQEKKDRIKVPWRIRGLVFLVICMLIFDHACFMNTGNMSWWWSGLTFQIFCLIFYSVTSWKYTYSPGEDLSAHQLELFPTGDTEGDWKPNRLPLFVVGCYFLSSVLFATGIICSNVFSFHPSALSSAQDIKAEREKLEDQLTSLRMRTLELEAEMRKKELAEFIREGDAAKRFLTKDEATQYIRQDEANKGFATRSDLQALGRKLDEAKKGLATKEELESLKQRLQPK